MKKSVKNEVSKNPKERLHFAMKVLFVILMISAAIFALAYFILKDVLPMHWIIILFLLAPFFLICFIDCIMKKGNECWFIKFNKDSDDFDIWTLLITVVSPFILLLVSPIEILVTYKKL